MEKKAILGFSSSEAKTLSTAGITYTNRLRKKEKKNEKKQQQEKK